MQEKFKKQGTTPYRPPCNNHSSFLNLISLECTICVLYFYYTVETPTSPPLQTPIYFIYNKFRFNESVTVYWTGPTAINPSCNESRYIYHLVKSNDGVIRNNTALGQSNHATISRNDLESPTSKKLYSFHVVAMDGNITCARSTSTFSIPQNSEYP